MDVSTHPYVLGMRTGIYVSSAVGPLLAVGAFWFATGFVEQRAGRLVLGARIAALLIAAAYAAYAMSIKAGRVEILEAGLRFHLACSKRCPDDACRERCRCATKAIADDFGEPSSSALAQGSVEGMPGDTVMRAGRWCSMNYTGGVLRPAIEAQLTRIAQDCAAGRPP